MNRASRRRAAAVVAASAALVLAGCSSSGDTTASPTPSHMSVASVATTTAPSTPSVPPSPTQVPPGPTFTMAALDQAMITPAQIGPAWKNEMNTTTAVEETKSAYRFGCLNAMQAPPSRAMNGDTSKGSEYQLPYFDPAAKSLLSSYTLGVQYVLYPTAQAAADEQRALEATVTPQCLHVGHESDPGYFPFDITSTAGAVAEAGFTGTSIHSVMVGTSSSSTNLHKEDWQVEARSGALLVTVEYDHSDGPGNGTPFEADAGNWVAKILDKLATAGH